MQYWYYTIYFYQKVQNVRELSPIGDSLFILSGKKYLLQEIGLTPKCSNGLVI